MADIQPTTSAEVLRSGPQGQDQILTEDALQFLFDLESTFGARRRRLLADRTVRQQRIDAGELPDFLPETRSIRESDWTVDPVPTDLLDRRVEITGPVDRKMIINALNSGASVFMADFEDSHSPTWANCIEGQLNLRDAVRRQIDFTNDAGKQYRLNQEIATLFVRPRGWHLEEDGVRVNGRAMSASLFDFGLFFFHNAAEQLRRGTGPYFYLPKLESHHEARLWNDVFLHAQKALGIEAGTIKATVLVETILAAFEQHEILWELRQHSAGLNCGRWDYIFSFIKKFHRHPEFLLPDRAEVGMTTHFLRQYSQLVIQTCHRRGIHAMGGMAAQIPIKTDALANENALAKVRADKEREVADGHDGTWVAHPGLVAPVREIFDRGMPSSHQIGKKRDDVSVSADDLLKVPTGSITEGGLRTNVEVGLRYLEAWLRGVGCVPIHHLMEDAATAEISRTQLWQWIVHPLGRLEDGREITVELFRETLDEVLHSLHREPGDGSDHSTRFDTAAKLYDDIITHPELIEFLTIPAYQLLNHDHGE